MCLYNNMSHINDIIGFSFTEVLLNVHTVQKKLGFLEFLGNREIKILDYRNFEFWLINNFKGR